MEKEIRCYLTGEIIPEARVEFLRENDVPEEMMTSINGAKMSVRKKKMVGLDEDFTDVRICNSIGGVFNFSEEEEKIQASEVEELSE